MLVGCALIIQGAGICSSLRIILPQALELGPEHPRLHNKLGNQISGRESSAFRNI